MSWTGQRDNARGKAPPTTQNGVQSAACLVGLRHVAAHQSNSPTAAVAASSRMCHTSYIPLLTGVQHLIAAEGGDVVERVEAGPLARKPQDGHALCEWLPVDHKDWQLLEWKLSI
jgi:hypothetical protein